MHVTVCLLHVTVRAACRHVTVCVLHVTVCALHVDMLWMLLCVCVACKIRICKQNVANQTKCLFYCSINIMHWDEGSEHF